MFKWICRRVFVSTYCRSTEIFNRITAIIKTSNIFDNSCSVFFFAYERKNTQIRSFKDTKLIYTLFECFFLQAKRSFTENRLIGRDHLLNLFKKELAFIWKSLSLQDESQVFRAFSFLLDLFNLCFVSIPPVFHLHFNIHKMHDKPFKVVNFCFTIIAYLNYSLHFIESIFGVYRNAFQFRHFISSPT